MAFARGRRPGGGLPRRSRRRERGVPGGAAPGVGVGVVGTAAVLLEGEGGGEEGEGGVGSQGVEGRGAGGAGGDAGAVEGGGDGRYSSGGMGG